MYVQNRADLVLQGPDVRLGARMSSRMAQMSGLRPGCPARRFQISFGAEIFVLGAEMDDSKGKIGEILWMERGKKMGES